MRAWQFSGFGDIDKLGIREIGQSCPGPGEVRVTVSFAGINHVDRLVVNGRLKWVSLPKTPGAEYVGTVSEAGEGVHDFHRGDRVAVFPKMFCGRCRYCLAGQEGVCLSGWNPERAPVDLSTNMLPSSMDGGWAEEALIPSRNLVKLPESLGFREAACLPLSAMTASHIVSRVRPSPGESAVVVGANGGVGHFAVQLLNLSGLAVIAIASSASQEEAMKSLGADFVIARDAGNVRESILSQTGGYGADIIVDSIGQATFRESLNSLAPCGRYVTAGTLSGPFSELSLMQLYSRQLELIGSTTGSRRDLEAVVDLASRGKMKGVVAGEYAFEELPAALEEHAKGGRLGKILLRVG